MTERNLQRAAGDEQAVYKPCIALLDDDPYGRAALRWLLDGDYSVEDFSNVPDLLTFLEVARCDVIVSDLSLPGLDGFDLIKVLKKDPHLASIPIIALTGNGSDNVQRRALDAGFAAVCVKPADAYVLMSTIADQVNTPAPREIESVEKKAAQMGGR